MIIVLTTNNGRVYEVINSDNLIRVYDKWNWLQDHLEDLGYMMIKETPNVCEFANKDGWRYGIMLADEWVKNVSNE